MTVNRLLRELLNVKGAGVAGFGLREHEGGAKTLVVHVRLYKRDKWRCPVCGRKCPVHDYACGEAFWRGMDFGPVDWKTVGRLVELVWHDLEPDVRKRFDGLRKIGIDETSYKKGHSYITTVVNHETNTVIWACEGHGKEAVDKFFKELTPERRASIEVVTGDGARWITDSCAEHCPGAKRCLDPFHAVEWANAALNAVRVEAWRRALEKWRGMGRPKNGDGEAKEARRVAKKAADDIKHSKYALGKNPENLTPGQQGRLAVIQAGDGALSRAYVMKEQLRLIFKMTDAVAAAAAIDRWTARAQRCRIPAFVELQRKIRRHRGHIINAIRHHVSNARIEALNNRIKLLIRVPTASGTSTR